MTQLYCFPGNMNRSHLRTPESSWAEVVTLLGYATAISSLFLGTLTDQYFSAPVQIPDLILDSNDFQPGFHTVISWGDLMNLWK